MEPVAKPGPPSLAQEGKSTPMSARGTGSMQVLPELRLT